MVLPIHQIHQFLFINTLNLELIFNSKRKTREKTNFLFTCTNQLLHCKKKSRVILEHILLAPIGKNSHVFRKRDKIVFLEGLYKSAPFCSKLQKASIGSINAALTRKICLHRLSRDYTNLLPLPTLSLSCLCCRTA